MVRLCLLATTLLATAFASVRGLQSLGQTVKVDVLKHDFWRKPRSVKEITAHVDACLTAIDGKYDNNDDGTSRMNSGANLETATTLEVLSDEPPLVLMHGFLSDAMCKEIIQSAESVPDGFKRSTIGSTQETSLTRTSSQVWLKDEDCCGPLRLIAEKVSSITGLPANHMENLQVARYLPGQEFKVHTDHLDSFNDLACGGRLATFLIYLAEPLSGGSTWFPCLQEQKDGIHIAPRQGSALFFWNTLQRPGSEGYTPDMFLNADPQMRHAGTTVGSGEKIICNRWVHPMDFGARVRGI